MESNQDQALMRGPPDHRANGPDIPLSGYAAGLVRLAAGLYVIRCAVSHQKSIFLSSALDDTNGILALMVSSCLVPPPASCGEERHMADSRLSSRPLAFNLIAQCLFCFPSGLWRPSADSNCCNGVHRSTHSFMAVYKADSVSTRSAGRSRFLCVGTPGQVIAATASASMTGGRHLPSPGPSDALGYPV